jgi:hypothetical protein
MDNTDLCVVIINSQIKVSRMKKLKLNVFITAMSLLVFIPVHMYAENEKNSTMNAGVINVETKSNTVHETNVAVLSESDAQLTRLEEIKSMDMSTLSRAEKSELREEVKAMSNEQPRWRRSHRHGNDNYDGRSEDNRGRRHESGSIFIFGGTGLLLLLVLLLLI